MEIITRSEKNSISISSGVFPTIKCISRYYHIVEINWGTFTIFYGRFKQLVENTDGFSYIRSYKNEITYYSKHKHIHICFGTQKMLIHPKYFNHSLNCSEREQRIKILANELLFCKRRKELTKAIRIYKENRRRKLLTKLEKYMPMDICKIAESYVYSEISPVINCKWKGN